MNNVRRQLASSAAIVCASFSLMGCAADATGGASVQELQTSDSHSESLTNVTTTVVGGVTSTLGQVSGAAGLCTPLTCCFPTGAEWGQNAFEDGLKALGCTMPAAYTERYESSQWWMFSKCPVSPALLALVATNANVTPYYSSLAINECLYLDNLAGLHANDVFVQFDPTCTSCRTISR